MHSGPSWEACPQNIETRTSIRDDRRNVDLQLPLDKATDASLPAPEAIQFKGAVPPTTLQDHPKRIRNARQQLAGTKVAEAKFGP
jgi:hypothetical protein